MLNVGWRFFCLLRVTVCMSDDVLLRTLYTMSDGQRTKYYCRSGATGSTMRVCAIRTVARIACYVRIACKEIDKRRGKERERERGNSVWKERDELLLMLSS